MESVAVEHVTTMLPTLALAVPLPLVTMQDCTGFVGFVNTVTTYMVPAVRAVGNVNPPLAVMVRLSPPLSCRTRPVPERLTTVPPMVTVPDEPLVQVTRTVVTLAVAAPVPPVTVQVCAGVVG